MGVGCESVTLMLKSKILNLTTYACLHGNLNYEPFSISFLSRCNKIRNVVNGTSSGLGAAKWIFLKIWQILILKHIALTITTQKSRISNLAVLSLQFEKTNSISPQIISSVYETMKPFTWFLIGQLVTRLWKLPKTKRITYVEEIVHDQLTSIPTTCLTI